MIKKIMCQLWNQRRMNGWIFIELVIVSFFLWTVVDPIYVLTATGLIDPGYDAHEKYVVKIDAYDASNTNYQQEMEHRYLVTRQTLKMINTCIRSIMKCICRTAVICFALTA